jgi:release factor glutamine methyltransferase
MKIKEALVNAKRKLKTLNSADFSLEAEILLSAVLKKNKEYVFSHPDDKISVWQNFLLQKMLKKRLAGYSCAVLTGHKWFYGLDFIVNKHVLVPRPETELMVEEVIKIIFNSQFSILNLIDVGTGSGCVAISLAKNFPTNKINFYGLDISKKALAVAKKNAKKNGVSGCINFVYSDLLNVIDKNIFNEPVIITANLPYLTPEQVKNSLTIQKEPRLALLAGIDGLNCYRRLFQQIKNRGIKNELIIFCEIDEVQGANFIKTVNDYLPEASVMIIKDLSGQDRLARLTIVKK